MDVAKWLTAHGAYLVDSSDGGEWPACEVFRVSGFPRVRRGPELRVVTGFATVRTHRFSGAPAAGEFYDSLESLCAAVAASRSSSSELSSIREAMWLTKHVRDAAEDVVVVLLGDLVPLPVLREGGALRDVPVPSAR